LDCKEKAIIFANERYKQMSNLKLFIMELQNVNIQTITNEEALLLADEIFAADNGYGKYSVQQLNKILITLGIADGEGVFYSNLSGREKEVANLIIDRIS
jgi:hypothetical protein